MTTTVLRPRELAGSAPRPPARPATSRATGDLDGARHPVRDHLELVRAPAVLTVLGDTVAGASAAGLPLSGRRALLPLASACLYAGGMALNDWADREVDAVERPERPVPSGRVTPRHALGVAAGLGTAGLALAAAGGGRRALAVAAPLAVSVWLYDARLKDTAAGPVAMAACRGLDVLLGAGLGHLRAAAPAAAALAAHTAGVTVLSRGEVHGTTRAVAGAVAAGSLAVAGAAVGGALASARPPVAASTATGPAAGTRGWIHSGGHAPASRAGWIHRVTGTGPGNAAAGPAAAGPAAAGPAAAGPGAGVRPGPGTASGVAAAVAAAAYLAQCLPAQVRARRTPTAPAARAATGAGIRAMIPLQAAWAAGAGRPGVALALGGVAAAGALLRRASGRRAVSET